jgi:hypothetical protein
MLKASKEISFILKKVYFTFAKLLFASETNSIKCIISGEPRGK